MIWPDAKGVQANRRVATHPDPAQKRRAPERFTWRTNYYMARFGVKKAVYSIAGASLALGSAAV